MTFIMKDIETLVIDMLKRVKQHGEDHELVPPNPKATLHYGEVDDILAGLADLSGAQDLSKGTLRGTTGEKYDAAIALRKQMGNLAKVAKVLDKAIYPTVAAEMRLSGAYNYPDLLERGRAFILALTGKTAAFIEYGASATALADLQAAVTALETAINRKGSAKSTCSGSTAGIAAKTSGGRLAVRKLDAILSAVYADDPVLLAGWQTARRIHRARVEGPAEEEPAAPPAPTEPPASGS